MLTNYIRPWDIFIVDHEVYRILVVTVEEDGLREPRSLSMGVRSGIQRVSG